MRFREVEKLMKENGYSIQSQNGSHVKFVKNGVPAIVIPNHNGKDINTYLLRRVFRKGGVK